VNGIPIAANVTERHFADAVVAAQTLAAEIAAALQAGIAARGRASLALSGGRSPVPFLHALSALPVDWPLVFVTLVDERWVDPASLDSNEGLLRRHLLRGAAAAAQFVPLKTAAADPAQAIAERSGALSALPHPFDALVLGMGEDGHTASLFPGAAGVEAALDPKGAARLAAVVPPAAAHARLSLTLAALLDARCIYLQIQGRAKRRIYEAALRTADAAALPIARVLHNGSVPVRVFVVD
jgi:6-phosphogluconolactonase